MSGIHADVSVRPAILGDEHAIADIQFASWRASLGEETAATIPRDDVRDTWGSAIETPPSREHRVFAACAGPEVVGFAAIAPRGEIVALEVAPEHRRQGHGARLLAACVDTMRVAGVEQLRAWSLAADDHRNAFYESAGLAPGGVERTLDSPGGAITEALWRAAI